MKWIRSHIFHLSNMINKNMKVNLFLCLFFNWPLRHEGVLGEWRYSPRIFYLGTRWRWVVSFTPQPIYHQGKSTWYPLDRRLGEPQSRSGRGGEEKHSQPLLGLEPPIIQPVAQRYTTELSRLLIKKNMINIINPGLNLLHRLMSLH
jgi:hypothetical protein